MEDAGPTMLDDWQDIIAVMRPFRNVPPGLDALVDDIAVSAGSLQLHYVRAVWYID